MELVRGQVTDRPWGQTLGALGLRNLTGQLTLHADDGKDYCIAFERGAVIGARSPLPIDAAARVALTNHLISSSQVADIARRVVADPDRDEIETLAEVCRFSSDQILRLRQRVIAQRAARTFAIERGTFVVDDQVAIPTWKLAAVDLRAVVYLGIRVNLSDARLVADLHQLGTQFALKPEATGDLVQFGFAASEYPIFDTLKLGATLSTLETAHPEVDPRTLQAMICALACCFACEARSPAAPESAPPIAAAPSVPRTTTSTRPGRDPEPAMPRTRTSESTSYPVRVTRRDSTSPPIASTPRTATGTIPPGAPSPGSSSLGMPRTTSSNRVPISPRTITHDPSAMAAEAYQRAQSALRDGEVSAAIEELSRATELVPTDVDYQAMLAWAQFCNAADKTKLADKTRKLLSHAVHKSPRPEVSQFYLGRMERMLGYDREALRHFHEVLGVQPRNAEAASEVRLLESRLAAGSAEKPGLAALFSRKKP